MADKLLRVSNLSVRFQLPGNPVDAVRNVSFDIEKGETVALVGESGSGKSVTALSIMQLLPYPLARHPSGSIVFDGQEIIGAPKPVLQRLRGDRISMVFQEPMTSLNPLHTIEKQVNEVLFLHKHLTTAAARARTLELLRIVGHDAHIEHLAPEALEHAVDRVAVAVEDLAFFGNGADRDELVARGEESDPELPIDRDFRNAE